MLITCHIHQIINLDSCRGVFVHFESKQQNSTKVTTGVSVPKSMTQDHVRGEREEAKIMCVERGSRLRSCVWREGGRE